MKIPPNQLLQAPKDPANSKETKRYLAGQMARLSLQNMIHLDPALASSHDKQTETLSQLEKAYIIHLDHENNND